MQRRCVAEESKSGKILFAPALRDSLKESVAYAESAPRFLVPYVVGCNVIL